MRAGYRLPSAVRIFFLSKAGFAILFTLVAAIFLLFVVTVGRRFVHNRIPFLHEEVTCRLWPSVGGGNRRTRNSFRVASALTIAFLVSGTVTAEPIESLECVLSAEGVVSTWTNPIEYTTILGRSRHEWDLALQGCGM